ncbi:MAG: hypothetical protein II007_09845 [Gammaproteobacteria bacterium]|nr:hypothetical protein [Gammaproteobacteria bacterium]
MSDEPTSALPRHVAKILIGAGAFALHFGLSALLFPLLYNAHKLLPALQGWISDGESYIRIGSTLLEALIALLVGAYIARLASKPWLLTALLSLLLIISQAISAGSYLLDGTISLFDYVRGIAVALALLWLGVWFWLDLMGWGKKAA